MRNSKTKGFTLVELIVVIAIIAILAAILVPNMLGYIRNSRFSQADANAKNVHTAATAAIAQAYADGLIGTGDGYIDSDEITETGIEITDSGTGDSRKLEFKVKVGTKEVTMNLVNGLGANFKGKAMVWVDTNTQSVVAAAWASDAINSIPTAFVKSRDKSNKKTAIIGYFPIPADPSTTAA